MRSARLTAHMRHPQGVIRSGCKWLVGFSDVSALHAMLYSNGIASIHGPMAKHLTLMGPDAPCSKDLFEILEGTFDFEYQVPGTGLDTFGCAEGILRGGNLAVFTEYKPDANFSTIEAMIRTRLDHWHLDHLPVVFDFPVGHVDYNLPLTEGARVRLEIDGKKTLLRSI